MLGVYLRIFWFDKRDIQSQEIFDNKKREDILLFV